MPISYKNKFKKITINRYVKHDYYDPLAMKAVDTSFFCILTNHSYTGHVRDSYAKDNNMSCYLVILLSYYFIIPSMFDKYK